MNQIPKIIHYCWLGKGKLPQTAQKSFNTWRKYCPDYRFVRWSEKNFDINKHLFTRRAYQQQNWGAINDYLRLYALKKMGGVYLNVHTKMVRPLDPLMHRQAFIGLMRPGVINGDLIWGAKPMDANVIETLDFVNRLAKRNDLESRFGDQTYITTAHFLKYGLAPADEKQLIKDCRVYPTSYFNPDVKHLTAHTYTVYQSQQPVQTGSAFRAKAHFYLKRMI